MSKTSARKYVYVTCSRCYRALYSNLLAAHQRTHSCQAAGRAVAAWRERAARLSYGVEGDEWRRQREHHRVVEVFLKEVAWAAANRSPLLHARVIKWACDDEQWLNAVVAAWQACGEDDKVGRTRAVQALVGLRWRDEKNRAARDGRKARRLTPRAGGII